MTRIRAPVLKPPPKPRPEPLPPGMCGECVRWSKLEGRKQVAGTAIKLSMGTCGLTGYEMERCAVGCRKFRRNNRE